MTKTTVEKLIEKRQCKKLKETTMKNMVTKRKKRRRKIADVRVLL